MCPPCRMRYHCSTNWRSDLGNVANGKGDTSNVPDSVEYLEMVNWRWMGIQKASLVGIK